MNIRKRKLSGLWLSCRPSTFNRRWKRGEDFPPPSLPRSLGITAVVVTAGLAVPFALLAGFVEPAAQPVLGFARFAATLGLTARFPASIAADLAAIAVELVAIAAVVVAAVAAGHAVVAVPSFGPLDHPPFEFTAHCVEWTSKQGSISVKRGHVWNRQARPTILDGCNKIRLYVRCSLGTAWPYQGGRQQ